jgi:hypothetical protein
MPEKIDPEFPEQRAQQENNQGCITKNKIQICGIALGVICVSWVISSAAANLLYPELEPWEQDSELAQRHSTTLDVAEMDPSAEQRYVSSLVGLYIPEESSVKRPFFTCTGTAVGKTLVLTAAHCIDDSSTIDILKPTNIFDFSGDTSPNLLVTTSASRTENVTQENIFPEYRGDDESYNIDVGIVQVEEALKTPAAVIADSSPEYGDTVYLYSRFGDQEPEVHGGRVVSLPSGSKQTIEVVFPVDKLGSGVCIPGTSGTSVANDLGEVVGVNIARRGPFVLAGGDVALYGFSQSEIGKTVVECVVVPITTAKTLVKDTFGSASQLGD